MPLEERGDEKTEDGGGERDANTIPAALRPPAHLFARIFSQLDCVDLLHCSLVCKQWYRESAELREDWKNEYLEACTLFGMYIKRGAHQMLFAD